MAPATKVKLKRFDGKFPIILIKDNFQNKLEIRLPEGNIFAACFHLILLRRIGGSESFTDKQVYFNFQLTQFHQSKNRYHSRILLKIDRASLIDSSLKATRNFTEANWCQLFHVEFQGEPGIDQGGLRREWFEIICKQLFSPGLGLFVPVEDGGQAVMPNPYPPPIVKKLNLFKFAGRITGKCLYESAQGQVYQMFIPVRLAKSFLAQLVGLRVHYRHFADDAPEFFAAKINRIETNIIGAEGSGLDDLTFSEELIDPSNPSSVRVINLKPNGADIAVTEDNKLEYLDLLAQYRLSVRIKEQTEQFLEGLNSLVPDNLLSLFDENELELLISGVRDYKVADLKRFHSVIAGTSSRTVDWFWLALEHFTQEQFSKLIQFSTGSSQIPSEGFSGLRPQFQISSSGTWNNLPTAHTCFNMICLPEYSSFADFEKALLTAITEGSEGFGFA